MRGHTGSLEFPWGLRRDQRCSPGSCPSTSGAGGALSGNGRQDPPESTDAIYGRIFCLIAQGWGNFLAVTSSAKSPLTYCNGGFSYAK